MHLTASFVLYHRLTLRSSKAHFVTNGFFTAMGSDEEIDADNTIADQSFSVSGHRHDDSQINQLATHLPDMVVYADHSRNFPYQTTLQGVLMFLDISGLILYLQFIKIFSFRTPDVNSF